MTCSGKYSAVFVSGNRLNPRGSHQPRCFSCLKSVISESDSVSTDRARRADTPRADKIATVATAVMSGKCQNSHSMVDADSAKIINSAAVFVRMCDNSVMPASPNGSMPRTPTHLIQWLLLNGHTVITPNGPEIAWALNGCTSLARGRVAIPAWFRGASAGRSRPSTPVPRSERRRPIHRRRAGRWVRP